MGALQHNAPFFKTAMNNRKFNRLWSLAITVALALAAACLIFTSVIGNVPKPQVARTMAATPEISLPPDASAEPAATPSANPIQQSTSAAALGKTAEAGAEYIDGIFFLGDGALKELQNGTLTGENAATQVWCPAANTADLNNLSALTFHSPVTGNDVPAGEIAMVNRPTTMILLPSADNANLLTEATLKAAVKTWVESIAVESPETHIILSSLTPIAESYPYEDVTIEVINRVNQWLAEAAEENNVKFLDAAFDLAETSGFLPENFQSGDGMHLNTQGVQAWFDCVKTHVYNG